MKATISKIDHYTRKSDSREISKISFAPEVDEETGEVLFLSPRWSEGHLDPKKFVGKIGRVE